MNEEGDSESVDVEKAERDTKFDNNTTDEEEEDEE